MQNIGNARNATGKNIPMLVFIDYSGDPGFRIIRNNIFLFKENH